MGFWIRAICRDSVAGMYDLDGIAAALSTIDWHELAKSYELSTAEADDARTHLHFIDHRPEYDVISMHYREARDRPIGIERWTGESAREECEEMIEMTDEDAPARIFSLLADAKETIAFELKSSDTQSMGWPIAFHIAMLIALKGDGLVEAEGAWFCPVEWDRIA